VQDDSFIVLLSYCSIIVLLTFFILLFSSLSNLGVNSFKSKNTTFDSNDRTQHVGKYIFFMMPLLVVKRMFVNKTSNIY
jgi:hypothetical protein